MLIKVSLRTHRRVPASSSLPEHCAYRRTPFPDGPALCRPCPPPSPASTRPAVVARCLHNLDTKRNAPASRGRGRIDTASTRIASVLGRFLFAVYARQPRALRAKPSWWRSRHASGRLGACPSPLSLPLAVPSDASYNVMLQRYTGG